MMPFFMSLDLSTARASRVGEEGKKGQEGGRARTIAAEPHRVVGLEHLDRDVLERLGREVEVAHGPAADDVTEALDGVDLLVRVPRVVDERHRVAAVVANVDLGELERRRLERPHLARLVLELPDDLQAVERIRGRSQ